MMTQEKANKIFATELGQQLDVIYVTSDDRAFLRYGEAVAHTNEMLNGDPENYVDTTITEWYPADCDVCGTPLDDTNTNWINIPYLCNEHN